MSKCWNGRVKLKEFTNLSWFSAVQLKPFWNRFLLKILLPFSVALRRIVLSCLSSIYTNSSALFDSVKQQLFSGNSWKHCVKLDKAYLSLHTQLVGASSRPEVNTGSGVLQNLNLFLIMERYCTLNSYLSIWLSR